MRYGIGQRGALPRGAKQYLRGNPNAVKVYLHILANEPCNKFPQDELGINIQTIHGILARLHSYLLIRKKVRINCHTGNLYEWRINPSFVDKMMVLIEEMSE